LIPRPIVGAVFMMICGMIATAGLKLLAFGEKDEVQALTTAFTLIAALTIPLAAPQVADWFAALPPSGKLFLSNSVVIATCLGIGLNATLRAMLPRALAPAPRQ
jgi:xanthine/uracil permease